MELTKDKKVIYKCSKCKRENCKLWRDYNTFLNHIDLMCAKCAAEKEKKNISQMNEKGKYPDERGFWSDQIGWLVPAVTTIEEDTFWGYTSVPLDRCEWWWALPN